MKGRLLGVEAQDIEEELFIPLSRPLSQPDARQPPTMDNLHLSITLNNIPKRSFLNPPLKNSFFGFEGSGFEPPSINSLAMSKANFESNFMVGPRGNPRKNRNCRIW